METTATAKVSFQATATEKLNKQNKDCLYNIRLTAEELQAWHDLAKETGFTKTSKMLHHAVELLKQQA